MIGAFRSGETAGSYAAYEQASEAEPMQAARDALDERKKLGVAHCSPEEEFISGFLVGYAHPSNHTDGLLLFVLASRNQQQALHKGIRR